MAKCYWSSSARSPRVGAMVSDRLGVPADKIRLAQADTNQVAIGCGTYASRSVMVGGRAFRRG